MNAVDDDTLFCLSCGKVVIQDVAPAEGVDVCQCHQAEPASAGSVKCPACGGSLAIGARACPFCHSTVATQRCSACLAWNLADARHCHECGGDLAVADSKSAEKTGKSCPRCAGNLVARRYSDLRVSECDACGGMMVDVEMMTKIAETHDKSTALRLALPQRVASKETEVHYIACPVCKKSMNRRQFGRISGVVVDVCKQDGVWFDPGELSSVLTFIARGGLEEARKRELDDLQESKRASHAAAIQAAAVQAGHDPGAGDVSIAGRELDLGREILAAFRGLWS
ncbi:MAG: zf-TFIIB domain-containing protein [Polyangiaceae bacterium]